MNDATKNFIKQWLEKANEDLFVVERLIEYEIVATSSVCFHCQQAVEKFLKAFLIANGIDIKKTHNIEFLLSECSDIDKDFSGIEPKETIEYKNLAFEIKDFVEYKIEKILNSK